MLRLAARGAARLVGATECAALHAASGLQLPLANGRTAGVQQPQEQPLQQRAWPAQQHHRVRAWAGAQSLRAYSQCDCPTLGGPEPDLVVVEYDEDEVDRFIALADAIEAAFPNVVVEGNPNGPGRAGAFEVTAASGALMHSRLDSGAWPDPDVLVSALSAAAACDVKAAASGSGGAA